MIRQWPSPGQVQLERMKFVALQYVSRELADEFAIPPRLDLSAHGEFMLDQMVFRLRQDILGRELERIECRYPADWWQAFKARWFPAWALKRWPVKEMVKQLVARELYPKMAFPDEGAVLNLWESPWRLERNME